MTYKINKRYILPDIFVWIGLFVMLFTPVLYYECQSMGGANRIFSSILYILPVVFLLTCIRNKLAFFLAVSISTIVSSVETMMVVLYNNYLTVGNIFAILNTTTDEGGGFLISIISRLYEALPVAMGGIAAMFIHKGKTDVKSNFLFFLSALILTVAFLTYQLQVKWNGNITPRFYIEQNVLGRPPYNFAFQAINAFEQVQTRKSIEEAENMKYNAQRPHYEAKEAYVLYIGESLRYDNLSLGGYSRSTTPLLESLDNVTLYSNYYSTANLTMYSIPQILTRATADDFSLNYKEKSIFQPFKECGFKTYVICAGNLLTYEKYLSDGCDSLFVLSEKEDEKIVDIVDSLVNKHDKTFFILQGLGNHSPYKNFRKEQDRYHPNPISDNVSWDNHDAMVNAYDNTVLFTDYNAFNIIKSIDKPGMQSAFMMISDHGADYDTGVSDHGGNCNPRKAEYHVPLIFWHSTVWGDNHPKKKSNVLKHKDSPINADNVFYSVCDMADITIAKKYSKPEWSIFSDNLKLHERKLLVPDGKNYITVK